MVEDNSLDKIALELGIAKGFVVNIIDEFKGSELPITPNEYIAVLREGEAGAKVADLCRKYGMSDATYYNWKAKYAGLTVSVSRGS